MVVKILADCGIIENDTPQVSKVLHCIEVDAVNTDLKKAVCFLWRELAEHLRLMVRPNLFAASERWLMMSCRACSMWARRAQSSANICSVMSLSLIHI